MERKMEFVRDWADRVEEWLRQTDPACLTSRQKNAVQTLQKELPFLRMFGWYSGKMSRVFEDDLPSATKAIEAVDSLASIFEELEAVDCQDDEDSTFRAIEMFLQKLQYLHPVLKVAFLDLSDLLLERRYFSRDNFKELLDISIKNLKDLQVLKPDMIVPVKEKIGAFEKRLEFVSAIFHFASRDQHVDQLNSFFNHIKDWVNGAATVSFFCWVDEIDESVNATVSILIEKFKPCTIELAEMYLGALKYLKPSQEPDFYLKGTAVARFLEILLEDLLLPTDDGFGIIQHGLTFLISFHVNPPCDINVEEGKLIPTQNNLGVKVAASLICSLYASNLKEGIAKGSNNFLHNLVEEVNQAKAEIRQLQLEIPIASWNSFPRTNLQGFLDFFFEDLKEKLKYETLTRYQRHQVMTIQKLLLSLKPSLLGVYQLQDKNEELRGLEMQISKMAYSADYVIDSCFLSDATNYWQDVVCLSDVIEGIQLIKTELNKSRYTQMCNRRVIGEKMNSGGLHPPQANKTDMDDVMVGFTDEKDKIISFLTGGLPQREIVAIVGMAGQGKTTLAKKVYHETRVRLHFHRYAWCCISQANKIEDILISILKDVNPTLDKDDISRNCRQDLAERLYKCLKGNTYLIVLDDIWDIWAWNELKESFPDDKNGSRIMLTSRIHKVALEAKSDCSLHELHPLSLEDSMELLRQKLSYKDGFPLSSLDIGKKIAESCKGLPLAIVLIAGLLAKADGNLVFWKQIAESLKPQISKEGCRDTLELSYKHLPDYLKPCLLYLAAFREDESILTKRLTQYWIAEGFIRRHENKSLEHVANEYLKDLIDRSLLSAAKRSSRYGIKKCVVHDLVREFCLEKAKEENFLLVTNTIDNHSLGTIHQSYRICIHGEGSPSFLKLEPITSIVRTLICFNSIKIPEASFFFIRFKFLRVLELEYWGENYEIGAITRLACLRYLALLGAFGIVSSIVNLSRLEYLLLRVHSSIPRTIWNMRSLRCLYLGTSNFYSTNDLVDESYQLDILESFSSWRTCLEEEFKWQIRRMPNVRKLSVDLDFCLQLSGFLSGLESLKLTVNRKLSAPEFDLPSTLRKLTIVDAVLSRSVISAIGNLANLEVFKLLSTNFEDNRWDVEDDEFLKLKYLKLHFSYIEEWNVSTDSFPQIQQLILKHCNCLAEIPFSFGELSTLKVMKVFRCKKLANSAHEIVAGQEEIGNEDLQYQITEDFPDEE